MQDLLYFFLLACPIFSYPDNLRIPMKLDTCSNRWWTAVPGDDGRLFQSMVVSGAG
jgi:hypothetical protein